jgi:hypothetical protein
MPLERCSYGLVRFSGRTKDKTFTIASTTVQIGSNIPKLHQLDQLNLLADHVAKQLFVLFLSLTSHPDMARLVRPPQTELALHIGLVEGGSQTSIGLIYVGRVDLERASFCGVVHIEVNGICRRVSLGHVSENGQNRA